MSVTRGNLSANLLILGILSFGSWGCTSSTSTEGGITGSEGGTNAAVSGGSGATTSTTPSTGGTVGTTTTVATGGAKATGGAPGTGGATATGSGGSATGGAVGAGGMPATGGSTARGGSTGNGGGSTVSTGGAVAQGGSGIGGAGKGGSGTGGSVAATGGATGTATGGTTTTGCQKGLVKAQEVVFMGESFYAMSPMYNQKRVEANAKAAGAIGANDTYRNVAVSGQTMNYVLVTEWPNAIKSTTKVVIMDGGGIDCMSSSCASCPGDFTTLLGKMATAGVTEVIYTRYPEPGAPPGSNATLKGNLDILMPKMETVCAAATGLKCHWVDLRPVWVTGDTTDGLHPTQSGGNHVGDAIWAEMVKSCIAQ